MKKIAAFLTALLLCCPAAAPQAPSPLRGPVAPTSSLAASQVPTPDAIEIEGGDAKLKDVVVYVPKIEKVWTVSKLPFTLKVPADGVDYEWSWPEGVKAQRKRSALTILEAPKGELHVSCSWALIDFKADKLTPKSASITVHVGDVPTPVPPGPEPGPKPIPTPTGFRVIFVRESAEDMTREQLNIWNSPRLKDYLDGKVAKDQTTQGQQPSWRKWDKDTATDFAPPVLRQLFADTRPQWGALPVIVIAVDNKAVVHPFPATEQEALDLLKKVGG